jgi:hypothetical protein
MFRLTVMYESLEIDGSILCSLRHKPKKNAGMDVSCLGSVLRSLGV